MTKTDDHPTRKRLIKAATALFQERGYYAVGITEILRAAKVPKGSLYHHFPGGKEELAVAAVDRLRDEVLALIHGSLAAGKPIPVIVETVALGMGQWLARSQWRQGCLVGTLAQEVSGDDSALSLAVRNAFGQWQQGLAEALKAGGKGPQDAADLAMTIIAGLEGALITAKVSRSLKPMEQTARALCRAL